MFGLRRVSFVVLLLALLLSQVGRALAAGPPDLLVPPVDAVISRSFIQPQSQYGPGHRGIDYAVQAGTRVRAAGPGTVSWAGSVAGNPSVTIAHGGGLETTYSVLSRIDVTAGSKVDQGHFIGTVGDAHEGAGGNLHFGVKLDGAYVDPMDYLGPTDVSGAIHLAPLVEDERVDPLYELPMGHELTLAHEGAGAHVRPCKHPEPIEDRPPPPNDNVAVAIAGIGSHTKDGVEGKILESATGPRELGYEDRKIIRFSYAGIDEDDLHRPYVPADTWVDIEESAEKLRTQLVAVRQRFPHADVDLFAHSQGGLVARAMLEHLAQSYDPRLPRVEHLVTYGTPHRGSPLASVPADLKGTLTGNFFVDKVSDWVRKTGRVPDPRSKAVDQMRPGSDFLQELADEDVTFGTRVLSLAMPHDVIVPADRSLYPGKLGRMLPPDALHGHDSVVTSERGRSIAYSFLRDAAVSCTGGWDTWGPAVGSAIGWAQGQIADIYSSFETAGLLRVLKGAKWVAAKGWAVAKWTGAKTLDAARWAGSEAVDGVRWTGGKILSGARAGGRLIKDAWAALW